MHNYLKTILANKKKEVSALLKEIKSQPDRLLSQLYHGEQRCERAISFKQKLAEGLTGVIAEIKRKSPSKEHIADIKDPAALAKTYCTAGATAISVLTDMPAFGGSIADLRQVKRAVTDTGCPVLRKDFIIDKAQIAEAAVAGADAVLLIMAVTKQNTAELLQFTRDLNIDALVEVHTRKELDQALAIGAEIIGVNNRDLTTFEINLDTAKNLYAHIPREIVSVAESGITTPEIAVEFAQIGFNALLIGQALVQSQNPAAFIRKIRSLG